LLHAYSVDKLQERSDAELRERTPCARSGYSDQDLISLMTDFNNFKSCADFIQDGFLHSKSAALDSLSPHHQASSGPQPADIFGGGKMIVTCCT